MTTALSTVASERSYSRTTGSTSVEAVTAMPGRRLAQDLGDPPLVRGIGEGMQQADRDRLDAERAAGIGRRRHARLVERLDHHAARRRSAP